MSFVQPSDPDCLRAKRFKHRLLHAEVPADDTFVCFVDFERVAKREMHGLAASFELEDFTASLGIGDQFWGIQRFAGPPIVFVQTDEQAQASRLLPCP